MGRKCELGGRMRLTGHEELGVGVVVDVELETCALGGESVDVGREYRCFRGVAGCFS